MERVDWKTSVLMQSSGRTKCRLKQTFLSAEYKFVPHTACLLPDHEFNMEIIQQQDDFPLMMYFLTSVCIKLHPTTEQSAE